MPHYGCGQEAIDLLLPDVLAQWQRVPQLPPYTTSCAVQQCTIPSVTPLGQWRGAKQGT